MTKTSTLTAEQQLTLDTICDRVAASCRMGYIAFSLGWRDNVAQYVAKNTKRPVELIREHLAHLVAAGLISDNFVTDDRFEMSMPGMLGLTQKSWLAYSRLDCDQVASAHGLDDDGGFDAWLEWDRIEGTCLGGDFHPPFEPLKAKLILGRLYRVATYSGGGEQTKTFVRFAKDLRPAGVVVTGSFLDPGVQYVRLSVLRHGQLIPIADEPRIIDLMKRQAAEAKARSVKP